MKPRTRSRTVEEDVLLSDQQHDVARLEALLTRVAEQADRLEQECLPGVDQTLAVFRDELEQEILDGR